MQPPENKLLASPRIDPELETLSPIPRSTECFRHFVLSVEYWLSPKGHLRRWMKINFFLSTWLFIPAVILMPVVSVILQEVDVSLSILVSIVLKVILLTVLISVAVLVIIHFPSSSQGSSRRRK